MNASGFYDTVGAFQNHNDSRMRNGARHSMRSRDGWDKVLISKHHTQERKGIGTPGVGSYTLSPRRAFSSRSLVMRPPSSPRGTAPRSRAWFPFHPSLQSSAKSRTDGISFPKAIRDLSPRTSHSHTPCPPFSSQSSLSMSPKVSSCPAILHAKPRPKKSSPVSGLFMPIFGKNSRSISFTRNLRPSITRSTSSPRHLSWSSEPILSTSSSWTKPCRGAPKFGSPRTSPRLDFRIMFSL